MIRDRIAMAARIAIGASVLTLAACDDPYGGKCTIEGFGNIPILTKGGSPIIRANVNGHAVAFIVDTGAQMSTINDKAADRLKMIPTGATMAVQGIDGMDTARLEAADHFALGSGQAHDVAFWTLPATFGNQMVDGLPVVGLFGADFLLNYDLVIDHPNMEMGLYRVHDCPTPTPLWGGPEHKIPIDISAPHFQRGLPFARINIQFMLNGVKVDGILDSGAYRTMIPRWVAHDAGVTDEMLAHDPQIHNWGVANVGIAGWRHRFKTLQIGDIVLHDVQLDVLPDQEGALLGADFLRGHRVWIPRSGDVMYVQSHAEIPAQ